jgi:hypothetical protein
MHNKILNQAIRSILTTGLLMGGFSSAAYADLSTTGGFTAGDLVISTVSNNVNDGASTGDLDTASPITLQEFSLGAGGASATSVGSLTLPQVNSGVNGAISGEYGSASEGILQQSANGAYLTIMGYNVNASTFNSYYNSSAADLGASTSPYGTVALGQTSSIVGGADTTVGRTVALIASDGSVDTSTTLTGGIFTGNNPRSVATVDGSSFYVSGQGQSTTPSTQGVFYATDGASTATQIFSSNDTRAVEIVNNTLYMSDDNKANKVANVNTLTTASGGLPTSATGVTTTILTPGVASTLGGNQASINLTTALENGVNNDPTPGVNSATTATDRVGKFVYLSPEQYFFATVTGGPADQVHNNVMYVTDSGAPKSGSADAAAEGEGGLQKWELIGGQWTLQYDLVAGLNLVNNDLANSATPTAAGVTGLFGLTAQVLSNGTVELFATSYGLNELSPSYLYEITDNLSYNTITAAAGETFTTLASSAAGESIRGVAFAPTVASTIVTAVPLPPSLLMMLTGLGLTGIFARRGKQA